MPMVDFSSSSPLALKNNEMITLSAIVFRSWPKRCFINVDLPVPGFPFIQRKPRCSTSFSVFSQSQYSGLSSIHLHVLLWAFLIVEWRASICSNLRESKRALFCSGLREIPFESRCRTRLRALATFLYWTSSKLLKRHISMWLLAICSVISKVGRSKHEDVSSTTCKS